MLRCSHSLLRLSVPTLMPLTTSTRSQTLKYKVWEHLILQPLKFCGSFSHNISHQVFFLHPITSAQAGPLGCRPWTTVIAPNLPLFPGTSGLNPRPGEGPQNSPAHHRQWPQLAHPWKSFSNGGASLCHLLIPYCRHTIFYLQFQNGNNL